MHNIQWIRFFIASTCCNNLYNLYLHYFPWLYGLFFYRTISCPLLNNIYVDWILCYSWVMVFVPIWFIVAVVVVVIAIWVVFGWSGVVVAVVLILGSCSGEESLVQYWFFPDQWRWSLVVGYYCRKSLKKSTHDALFDVTETKLLVSNSKHRIHKGLFESTMW